MSTDRERTEVRRDPAYRGNALYQHVAQRKADTAARIAEALKAGNAELTEDDIVFGLKRAVEVYERHGNPAGPLQLNQAQLAAIIAGAHRDGRKV
jgi:hypothetical protein